MVNEFEYKTGYIWQIDCKVKNLKIEDIMLKFEFDNVQYIGNEREQIAKIDKREGLCSNRNYSRNSVS